MTDQQQSIWHMMRIIGPIFMFVLVFCVCLFGLKIPLVLSVVLALLLAIVELITLTWLMRRRGGKA